MEEIDSRLLMKLAMRTYTAHIIEELFAANEKRSSCIVQKYLSTKTQKNKQMCMLQNF